MQILKSSSSFLLFLLLQLLASYNIISAKGKIFIAGFLVVIAMGIGVFTIIQDKSDDKLTSLAQIFLQGKNLECQIGAKTLEANSEVFNFVSGTLTLVGKEIVGGDCLLMTVTWIYCKEIIIILVFLLSKRMTKGKYGWEPVGMDCV